MNTSKTTMHRTQAIYAVARAAYDTAVAAFNADAPPAPAASCSDEEFETWNDAEEACRSKHGLDRLHLALLEAESAMVEWAHRQARVHATEAQRADLADLHARGMQSPKIRTKLVALAFRLAA